MVSRVKKEFPRALNLILAAERNGSQFSLSTFLLVPVHEHDGIEGWPRTYKQSQFVRPKRLIFKFDASLPPTLSQNAHSMPWQNLHQFINTDTEQLCYAKWMGWLHWRWIVENTNGCSLFMDSANWAGELWWCKWWVRRLWWPWSTWYQCFMLDVIVRACELSIDLFLPLFSSPLTRHNGQVKLGLPDSNYCSKSKCPLCKLWKPSCFGSCWVH